MTTLGLQLRMTAAFINDDPTRLTVTPLASRAPDGEGGWTPVLAEPFDVVVKILNPIGPSGRSAGNEGTQENAELVVLSMPNVTLPVGSTFTYQGRLCEVTESFLNNAWENRVVVAVRG